MLAGTRSYLYVATSPGGLVRIDLASSEEVNWETFGSAATDLEAVVTSPNGDEVYAAGPEGIARLEDDELAELDNAAIRTCPAVVGEHIWFATDDELLRVETGS